MVSKLNHLLNRCKRKFPKENNQFLKYNESICFFHCKNPMESIADCVVGVVVATCDRPSMLSQRSIPSILNQTLLPKFLIIVDDSLDGKTVVYDFPERTIDLELAKEYLANDTGQIQWFLNTGNFLVNKKTYLETMKFIFLSSQKL